MIKYIDLHTHSVYSEGVLNCQQLLQLASKYQIKVLSLTDHNVIEGVPKITKLSKRYRITIIPGVEIYTHYKNKKLHLLAYNFKLGDTPLSRSLLKLQDDHITEIKRSIAKLKEAGFVLDEKKIFKNPSRYLGAIHLLQEIERHPQNQKKIKKEISVRHNNFFGKIYFYMGRGKPGYLSLSELPILQAIDIIKKSGGIAVLAHPGQQLTFEEDHLIFDLIKGGLDGLEVLSPYHNWHQIEHYQKLALENNLLFTGGSDFHRPLNLSQKETITKQWDYYKIPYSVYLNLKKHLK